jgi:flavin-binding protein dodecin
MPRNIAENFWIVKSGSVHQRMSGTLALLNGISLSFPPSHTGGPMSVAKIIEISCESPKSFEDAVQSGIARASKTIHNIKGAWVKEQQVVIENNKITMYRVDLKVTFVLD